MAKKNSNKVKYRNKKGCWSRTWPSLFTILIVLLVGIILFLEQFLMGLEGIKKYTNLLDELSIVPIESEIAPNKISQEDKTNFEFLINNLVTNDEANPIFDESGGFIYQNILPENIEVATGATLNLDKTSLACFINSCLLAGWTSDTDEIKLLTLLQLTHFSTTEQTTSITAVCKLKFSTLLEYATEEQQQTLSDLDVLLSDIYVVYTADFNYTENTILSSTMWINQLSEESNELLLELLFDKPEQAQSLNSIMEWILDEFNRFLTQWDITASFNNENLTLTKN